MTRRPRILFVGLLPPLMYGASVMNGTILHGLSQRGHVIEAVAPVARHMLAQDRCPEYPGFAKHNVVLPDVNLIPPGRDITANVHNYAGRLADMLPGLIARLRPQLLVVGNETAAPAIPDIAAAHGLPTLSIVHGSINVILDPSYPAEAAAAILPALRSMDRTITVSDHMAKMLRANGFQRVHTVPNAIDTRRFRPGLARARLRRRLGFDDDDVVILHPSNLLPVKCPLDIARSAVRAAQTEPRLHYIFTGDSAVEEDAAELRRLSGQAGRPFRFTGWRPHVAMPFYYAASDGVVMASEQEAAALTYLEAQASGCALLSSDIPAAREVIDHERTGVLFPHSDVDAIVEQTLRISRDTPFRRSLGRAARAWIEENRSLDLCLDAYAAHMFDVAGMAGPPSS